MANILKDSGDLQEAKQLLERAVKVRVGFAAAWMNLGIVQMALNQYEQAEFSYLNALKHRHRYAECFYNLGNLVSLLLNCFGLKLILDSKVCKTESF